MIDVKGANVFKEGRLQYCDIKCNFTSLKNTVSPGLWLNRGLKFHQFVEKLCDGPWIHTVEELRTVGPGFTMSKNLTMGPGFTIYVEKLRDRPWIKNR